MGGRTGVPSALIPPAALAKQCPSLMGPCPPGRGVQADPRADFPGLGVIPTLGRVCACICGGKKQEQAGTWARKGGTKPCWVLQGLVVPGVMQHHPESVGQPGGMVAIYLCSKIHTECMIAVHSPALARWDRGKTSHPWEHPRGSRSRAVTPARDLHSQS